MDVKIIVSHWDSACMAVSRTHAVVADELRPDCVNASRWWERTVAHQFRTSSSAHLTKWKPSEE